MLEQDYLMRMLLAFYQAIMRTWEKLDDEENPLAAADSLDEAIGNATDIDGGILLSLAPESIASVLQVSGTDPRIIEYIARSLLLSARYRLDGGDEQISALRVGQAMALADAYGLDLGPEPDSKESFVKMFERSGIVTELGGRFS